MLSKLLQSILDSNTTTCILQTRWFIRVFPSVPIRRGKRQWGLRRSDVQVSSLQHCHTVPELHSDSCKGSFSQLVLVPRMRKPPALLAFSLCHKSELLSPVKYDQHRQGEG